MASGNSEVSLCVKYSLFAFNVINWLIGAAFIGFAIAIWQFQEVFGDFGSWMTIITVIILVIGIIVFIISFMGCIGSLRENLLLLKIYKGCLGVILLLFLVAGILGFVFRQDAQDFTREKLLETIPAYRDDHDLQFIIDTLQEDLLECCGVDNPDDWDMNMYFNCSSPGVEACGVPYSCCQEPRDEEGLLNYQCGYGSRIQGQETTVSSQIWTRGCFETAKRILIDNILPIAGVALGFALLQFFGICLAQNLASDIKAQMANW